MNLTIYTEPMLFINNSMTTIVESWFILLDIFAILCHGLAIIFTILFLFIIILEKTCHTVRMMLIANMFLTNLICGCAHIAINVFALQNDLKQIQYQDPFCVFRGYLSYASCSLGGYSYVTLAIYQYIIVVYPTRLFWQTARMQIFLIVVAWILAFIFPLPFTFAGEITYNVDNQLCQVPYRFSLLLFYILNFMYLLPIVIIIFVYLKLVRFVRRMNQRITPANTFFRAQRDLTVVRRIVILILILLICGVPLTLFLFLSFFNRAPKYHLRIGYTSFNALILVVIIILFQFTDSLKAAVNKLIRGRRNTVIPAVMGQPAVVERKMWKKESVKMPSVRV